MLAVEPSREPIIESEGVEAGDFEAVLASNVFKAFDCAALLSKLWENAEFDFWTAGAGADGDDLVDPNEPNDGLLEFDWLCDGAGVGFDELLDENPRLIDELLLDDRLELLDELPDDPLADTRQGSSSEKIAAKTIGL